MTTGMFDRDAHDLDGVLYRTHLQIDGLRGDLDRLSLQVEQLLRERRHILEVLSTFYHSDLDMKSTHPVLDLCAELNPQIREGRR
jgi:hypothetical protein